MKIPLYIRELLLEGKNVAVAGLGTFECRRVPAGYDKENSQFVPPGRVVSFVYDEKIKGTDFTFYVTERESIKIEDAQVLIEEAVDEINYQLDRGKRLRYNGLGAFQRDQLKKIIFEPDQELLTGGEFFGLHPIPVAAYRKSKRSLGMKVFLVVLLVIGVGLVGYWGYIVWKMLGDQEHKLNTSMQLSSPEPAKMVISSPSQKALDSVRSQITPTKQAPVVSKNEPPKEVEPAKKSENKKSENQKVPDTDVQKGERFYIVAGCFRSEEGARKFVGQLKAKGYKSELIGKSEAGLHMVSYASFKSRAEADAELLKIRNNENKSAFIANH